MNDKFNLNEKEVQILISLGYELDKENNRVIEDEKYCYYLDDVLDIIQVQEIINDYYRKQQLEEIKEVELFETKKVNTIKKKERTHEILPTHSNVMRGTTSKEYNTLGMIVSKSNFNNEGGKMEAYIYEKDLETKLDEWKKENKKTPCLKTVKKHIKTLSKITIGDDNEKLISIENTPNGIVYKIQQNYKGKYFMAIPCEQLKELIMCTNNNVLKLLCIFKYTCNETEWKAIDRGYLVRHMGLTENEASENYISIATNVLRKLGYIKVDTKHTTELNKKGEIEYKKINYYQLTTFEEWKNKQ